MRRWPGGSYQRGWGGSARERVAGTSRELGAPHAPPPARPSGGGGASWRRGAGSFVVRAVVAACAAARGRTRGALACVVNPVFFPDSIHQPLELAGGELGAVDMRVLGDAGDECVGAAVADALGGAGVSQVTGVFGDGGELGDELVLDHDHGVFSPSRGGEESGRRHQGAGGGARG